MGRMEYTQYPVSILEPSSKKKKELKKNIDLISDFLFWNKFSRLRNESKNI